MDSDKNLCAGCNKPLDTKLDASSLSELDDYHSDIVEDPSRPGYFFHRLCRQVILDTTFKAVGK